MKLTITHYNIGSSVSCQIAAHSATKEQPVRYQCEICGHSFASTGSLKNHSFRHSDVKPYHCDICSKVSVSLSKIVRVCVCVGGWVGG